MVDAPDFAASNRHGGIGAGINGKFTANQIGGVFCKFSAI
jgi:hypothetical protein